MNRSCPWSSVRTALLIATVVVPIQGGCRARPAVICVMENPETGQQVELYRESRLKVPANYDEKQHIEQWKNEQRKRGFSVESGP